MSGRDGQGKLGMFVHEEQGDKSGGTSISCILPAATLKRRDEKKTLLKPKPH